MDKKIFDVEDADIGWCPGCGNFGILKVLKEALAELDISPEKVIMVSGIGQAAKTPHYIKTHFYNGLHGRTLSAATAIKACNPEMYVIAVSGDGCMYGEGGNHFIHTIRRNPNIVNLVHNNMVYGLTKGQASPTSPFGFKTSVQVDGVASEPFNPIAVAISLNASFVARASIANPKETKEIIKKAILHKGYALVDIFQPCVSFNKINTYQWLKDNTYYLESSYNPTDRVSAFKRAIETDKLPLGIFYVNPNKVVFEESNEVYRNNKEPLYKREVDIDAGLKKLLDARR